VIDRRTFLGTVAACLLAAPRASRGQQTRTVPVVGILHDRPAGPSAVIRTVQEGLRKLGYVEGQTITFDVRFGGGKPETLPSLARELAQRKVAVIVVVSASALRAARDATDTIPIVAINYEIDPVADGYARSLARPGGNVTGLFANQPSLTGKWLELIREAVPGVRRVALLRDPTTGARQLDAVTAAAQQLGMDLLVLEAQYATDLDEVFRAATKAGSRALAQLVSPAIDLNARRIAELTLRHGLPAISPFRAFAEGGGLMSYGPDQAAYHQEACVYVDKILKGAKPADLPIEQPTKFLFIINLKTAKALRLSLSPSLVARADRVIE
jgi:putative tryptophan/tyrosine transport system substrate-binding protein